MVPSSYVTVIFPSLASCDVTDPRHLRPGGRRRCFTLEPSGKVLLGEYISLSQCWHTRHPGWTPRRPGTPGDPRVIQTHPPPAKAAPRADPRVISRYPSCRVYTGCCEPGLSVHSSTTCSNTRCLHTNTHHQACRRMITASCRVMRTSNALAAALAVRCQGMAAARSARYTPGSTGFMRP